MCVLSRSVVSDSSWLLWTVAHQAPMSVEFFRQEYWSGLLFPTSGDLPDPGIKPVSLVSPALAGGFFTTASHGLPNSCLSSSAKTDNGVPLLRSSLPCFGGRNVMRGPWVFTEFSQHWVTFILRSSEPWRDQVCDFWNSWCGRRCGLMQLWFLSAGLVKSWQVVGDRKDRWSKIRETACG